VQELQERAVAIGGAAAEVVSYMLSEPISTAHPDCLRAILDAAAAKSDLNDAGLLCNLTNQSLSYTHPAASVAFRQSLEAAVKHCEPVGIKIAVDFVKVRSLNHRGMARMRPGVCDSLAILTELAKAGLFPRSEPAFMNCCKLIIDQDLPWTSTRGVARIIGVYPDSFRRAATGQPMTW
jgi:hypothetical protein